MKRYWSFIVRRFLRLYPCYLLCLVVSILMTQGNLDILQSIPWTTERIAVAQTIILTSLDNFWPNIASHIVLLQGAVPPSLIPYGEYAFLGQAWSISLEWQFYLVAPLLFLICKKQRRWALYLLLASVCIAYWGTGFKFGEGWIFSSSHILFHRHFIFLYLASRLQAFANLDHDPDAFEYHRSLPHRSKVARTGYLDSGLHKSPRCTPGRKSFD